MNRFATILDAVRAIPPGEARTYGEVSPGAPRLAGRALGSVHAPDVPWWRVVRADGSLAAGADQEARLRAEGVRFRAVDPPRVDLRAMAMSVGIVAMLAILDARQRRSPTISS